MENYALNTLFFRAKLAAYLNKKMIFLSQVILWQNLKAVCTTHVSKFLTIMPFAGYLVLYNESLKGYLDLEAPSAEMCGWVNSIPLFEQRTDLFYLGLVAAGAGVVLYHLFAPGVIKKYSDGYEYARAREHVGRYDVVASFYWIGVRAMRASKRWISKIEKLENKTQKIEFLRILHKFSSVEFPSHAYNRLVAISDSIVEDASDDKDWFAERLKEYCKRFHAVKVGEPTHLSKLEFANEVGDLTRHFKAAIHIARYHERVGRDIFILRYYLSNHSKLTARIFIALLIIIGAVLLFVPTFMTIVFAMDKICSSLSG